VIWQTAEGGNEPSRAMAEWSSMSALVVSSDFLAVFGVFFDRGFGSPL
jgi:hypothetical protein